MHIFAFFCIFMHMFVYVCKDFVLYPKQGIPAIAENAAEDFEQMLRDRHQFFQK